MAPDSTITKFIKTGGWTPISIHSSHFNGDIVVGMVYEGWFSKREVKLTRYSKTGKELQSIQRDNEAQELYSYPRYITENINGDFCVSDISKESVVVVNKSGQHKFSYTGQGSGFWPCGICTDSLGHILVCDVYVLGNTVHLLNEFGRFLSLVLTRQHGVDYPCCLCVDDENNLYVGQTNNNTVTVYNISSDSYFV
jgi:hypothetical protein